MSVWLDVPAKADGVNLLICVSVRGGGKTYSVLKEALNGHRLLYVRRTVDELELSASVEGNPYKQLNIDLHTDITMTTPEKGIGRIESGEEHDLTGYTVALSSAGKVKGTSFPDVDWIFFDEFIPVKGTRRMKNELGRLFHIYETVNRNRELKGQEPVKMFLCGNSETLESQILTDLGIVNIMVKMIHSGRETYTDTERGIRIYLPHCEEFLKLKSNTAIAKMARGTSYEDMAIMGNFAGADYSTTARPNLRDYEPIATFECGVTLYVYKGYEKVAYHFKSGVDKGKIPHYTKRMYHIARMKWSNVPVLESLGAVTFSDYRTRQIVLLDIFNIPEL